MISGNLEYLMSSLPHLSFPPGGEAKRQVSDVLRQYAAGTEADADLTDILDGEAAKFLSAREYDRFRTIDLHTAHQPRFRQGGSRLLAAFSGYRFSLKEEVARLRLARRERKNGSSSVNKNGPVTPGTPLEEEIQLLQLQWDRLEELSAGHYADLDALIAYKLKLMILQRRWNFDRERGFNAFIQITKAG